METKKEIVSGCSNLKTMTEWIQEKDDQRCRSCLLGPLASWYYEELKEQEKTELADGLDKITSNSNDKNMPLTLCQEFDSIKNRVEVSLRERLKEFDCATQNFSPDDAINEQATAKE